MDEAYQSHGKMPSFYEIAAKIVTFCDEMDKKIKDEKTGEKE